MSRSTFDPQQNRDGTCLRGIFRRDGLGRFQPRSGGELEDTLALRVAHAWGVSPAATIGGRRLDSHGAAALRRMLRFGSHAEWEADQADRAERRLQRAEARRQRADGDDEHGDDLDAGGDARAETDADADVSFDPAELETVAANPPRGITVFPHERSSGMVVRWEPLLVSDRRARAWIERHGWLWNNCRVRNLPDGRRELIAFVPPAAAGAVRANPWTQSQTDGSLAVRFCRGRGGRFLPNPPVGDVLYAWEVAERRNPGAFPLQGRAAEVLDLILERFRDPASLPAPLAQVFIQNQHTHASRLSLMNQFIIAMHGEVDAMGFQQWKEHGRSVKKGGRGFAILAPLTRTAEVENDAGEREERTIVRGFRHVVVFGLSQTEGEPYQLTGDDGFLASLPYIEVARAWGLDVATYTGSATQSLGYFSARERTIALGVKNPATFTHELTHAADHRLGQLDMARYGKDRRARADAEIVAELGGATLLAAVGLAEAADLGGAYSYLKHWSPETDPRLAAFRVLDRVLKAVQLVIGEAQRLAGVAGTDGGTTAPAIEPAPSAPAPPVTVPPTDPAPAAPAQPAAVPTVAALATAQSADAKRAAGLHALADRAQADGEAILNRDRLTNTPKRQREAQSARIEGGRLVRASELMRAHAQAWAVGSVPPALAGRKLTKADYVRAASKRTDSRGYYDIHETDQWSDDGPVSTALRALAESPEQQARERERSQAAKLRDQEGALRFAGIPGSFPTPPALARAVIAKADIRPGMRVLEPSAGKGDLAELARAAGGQVDVAEINGQLRAILTAKGFQPAADMMDIQARGAAGYDRIVMNPPFEHSQDREHVRHAYELLKPGGRLVAIMSTGPFQRQAAQDQVFRAWIASVRAVVENNPEGAFAGSDAFRQTGVRTVTVVIDKPDEANRGAEQPQVDAAAAAVPAAPATLPAASSSGSPTPAMPVPVPSPSPAWSPAAPAAASSPNGQQLTIWGNPRRRGTRSGAAPTPPTVIGIGRLVALIVRRSDGQRVRITPDGVRWLAWRAATRDLLVLRPVAAAGIGDVSTPAAMPAPRSAAAHHRRFHGAPPHSARPMRAPEAGADARVLGLLESVTYDTAGIASPSKRGHHWIHHFGDVGARGHGPTRADAVSPYPLRVMPALLSDARGDLFIIRRPSNRYRLRDWLWG